MLFFIKLALLTCFTVSFVKGYQCIDHAWIENTLRSAYIPGAAIVVVNNSDIIYEATFGYHSIVPETQIDIRNSIFTLASISKTFIAAAVMKLVEEKRLDLDTDINEYLAEPHHRIFNPRYPQYSITLRQLLSHSSSIAVNERVQISLYDTEDTAFERSNLAETLFYLLNSNTSNWLPVPPGNASFYSNEGSSLAGLVVERVTNTSFDKYVKDNIFKPLGIDIDKVGVRVSDFKDEEDLVKHYAYAPTNDNLLDWLTIMPQLNVKPLLDRFPTWLTIPYFGFSAYPAGLFRMSPYSLSLFLRMFINNGSNILNAASISEMRKIVGGGRLPYYTQSTITNTEGLPSLRYGLSWYWATLSDGKRYIGHSGSLPGSRHWMLVNEQGTLGTIFLSNGDSNGPNNRTFNVYRILENIQTKLFHCFDDNVDVQS